MEYVVLERSTLVPIIRGKRICKLCGGTALVSDNWEIHLATCILKDDSCNPDLLIKIAAREQRYACVEKGCSDEEFMHHEEMCNRVQSDIQNTPCPEPSDVIQKWQDAIKKRK